LLLHLFDYLYPLSQCHRSLGAPGLVGERDLPIRSLSIQVVACCAPRAVIDAVCLSVQIVLILESGLLVWRLRAAPDEPTLVAEAAFPSHTLWNSVSCSADGRFMATGWEKP
jgi:hypothetical protein